MSSRGTPSSQYLVPVDILTFRKSTRDISFDVYLKLSDNNIAHVFSKTTGLDYKRLAQYIQKGVKELYIHQDDIAAHQDFTNRTAESLLKDSNISQEKKTAILLNMTEQNISEIFSQVSVEAETAATTQSLVKNYVNIMVESPSTLTTILKLASHGDYLYFHSIAVSIFTIFLAKATGNFNQELLEIVGLGGFLHDIGLTQISKEITCCPTELTKQQEKEMETHPALGLKMIEQTLGIPEEVRYILYQHHEQPDGRGYPNKLKGSAIYYPASVVAVADTFSELISKRPSRPAYSVTEALQILEKSPGKYNPSLVKTLAAIFRSSSSANSEKKAA